MSRSVRLHQTYAELELSKGQWSKISLEDVSKALQHSWYAAYNASIKGYYAISHIKGKTTYLHRYLLDAPKGLTVDHLNHDTLDNRRENLRIVPIQENCQNRQLHAANKTGARGVSVATIEGRTYYAAKVAVVRWMPSKKAAKAEAARLRAKISSDNPDKVGRPGKGGVGFRKGRWVATASRTLYFPHTDEGLEQAKQAVADLRTRLKEGTDPALVAA